MSNPTPSQPKPGYEHGCAPPAPVREVEVMPVVRTRALFGAGTETDVVREVEQFWTMDGHHLFTIDPNPDGKARE